jgi:hypothetical protein
MSVDNPASRQQRDSLAESQLASVLRYWNFSDAQSFSHLGAGKHVAGRAEEVIE